MPKVEARAMGFGMIVQGRTPTLQAGRFRHKVDIVLPTNEQDSTGGFDLANAVLFARVPATVEAISGQETMAAGALNSEVTHKVVIRYIGSAPCWLSDTQYTGGALVKDINGNLQQSQSGGGTSGDTVPTWSTILYGLTQDGDPSTGIVWKNLGPAPERTSIVSKLQVIFQQRTFQILTVQNPDERNKMLILSCVEINDSLQQTPIIGATSPDGGIRPTIDGGAF